MDFLTKIKAWYIGYRILEINGLFIPQSSHSYGWQGIDRESFETWMGFGVQLRHCTYNTYEEANERLLQYIDYKKNKGMKIHSPTIEPKAWRILKKK